MSGGLWTLREGQQVIFLASPSPGAAGPVRGVGAAFLWGEISFTQHSEQLAVSLSASFSVDNPTSPWTEGGWETIGPCLRAETRAR